MKGKKKKKEDPLMDIIIEADKLKAMALNKDTGENYQLRVKALFKKIMNEIQNKIDERQ